MRGIMYYSLATFLAIDACNFHMILVLNVCTVGKEAKSTRPAEHYSTDSPLLHLVSWRDVKIAHDVAIETVWIQC